MRTPRQVFDDHWNSILAGDMDRVMADYATDAVFVRPDEVARGHDGIKAFFDGIGDELGDMELRQESVTVDGPIVLFEWSGRGLRGRSARGTDTFYVEGDRIRFQTLTYTVLQE